MAEHPRDRIRCASSKARAKLDPLTTKTLIRPKKTPRKMYVGEDRYNWSTVMDSGRLPQHVKLILLLLHPLLTHTERTRSPRKEKNNQNKSYQEQTQTVPQTTLVPPSMSVSLLEPSFPQASARELKSHPPSKECR